MKKLSTIFGVLAFITFGLGLFTAPAFASHLPTYVGVSAASMGGGELPLCPSMFRCRVR